MNDRLEQLTAETVDDLLSGAQLGVLSAASTFSGVFEEWIRTLLRERGPVPVIAPDDVAGRLGPDAWACTVGVVGSAAAMFEMPLQGDEPVVALRRLEQVLGHPLVAIAPLNAAGMNALMVAAAACLLGLPVIDVDGQGQVLPLIDQTTFTLSGLQPAPLVGVGPWGDVVTIESPLQRAEALERTALIGAGGWLLTALYPARAVELAAAGIPDSLSRCALAGRTLRSGVGQLAPRLAHELGGRVLGRGTVLEIMQHEEPDSPRLQPGRPLSIRLAKDGTAGAEILVEVRNEAVLALVDGTVAGGKPDVICLLDPLRGRTIDLLDLKVGDVVDVLLLPAHDRWHTEEGVRLAGPRSFGLHIPYRTTIRGGETR